MTSTVTAASSTVPVSGGVVSEVDSRSTVTAGTMPSITMFLLALSDPEAPVVGSVRAASKPIASRIVPPLAESALVLTYSRSLLEYGAATVKAKVSWVEPLPLT